MSLIFNAFTVWYLCPDSKHNKMTNFSDKSLKVNHILSHWDIQGHSQGPILPVA